MSSTLPTSFSCSSSDDLSQLPSLHLLPFHIAYSGPARIKGYFNPIPVNSLTSSDNGNVTMVSKAYFRGRMMLGTEIKLPEGYQGQVWKSNGPSMSSTRSDTSATRSPKKAATSTVNESYNPESPRRSPRKHAGGDNGPAAKKQKVVIETKKKKKKVIKRERFDMSPEPEEQQKPIDLDMLPVDGMGVEHTENKVEVSDNALKEDDEQMKDESGKVEASEQTSLPAPSKADMATIKAEDSIENIIKTESIVQDFTTMQAGLSSNEAVPLEDNKPSRASTPPPLSSSIPATPSTPLSSSSQPTISINTATPKPFFPPSSYSKTPRAAGEEDMLMTAEKVLKQIAAFDSFSVWNPDTEVDTGEDVYIRGIAEWTQLAELIHA